MYFHDRAEAGDRLADELMEYRYENTAVLALSPGASGGGRADCLPTTLCAFDVADLTDFGSGR